MKELKQLRELLGEVRILRPYDGYFCSIRDALLITLCGSFCGLRDLQMIHQWANFPVSPAFLRDCFGIMRIPSYSWLAQILRLIDPISLSEKFTKWVSVSLPNLEGKTLAIDGKTVRSTGKMSCFDRALHVVSAFVAESKMSFAQIACDEKSNEIPAVQELLKTLDLRGCVVVADALNCRRETAKIIRKKGGDYLLSIKDNHQTMSTEVEEYFADDVLRKTCDTAVTTEKNAGRYERRAAFVTDDIDWFADKNDWADLVCFGAINTQFTTKTGPSNEWHYYISSRKITAKELLHHARSEWSVETMHWLLDVHFREDFCQIRDKNVQQTLNILRKMALNSLNQHKTVTKCKTPISRLMFDLQHFPDKIKDFLLSSQK
jgi:predicted transposase YbfD/YdcC